jgi:guanosine-3',5'-bis(diphosphate) 3'-pyrophosphohydrolase
MRLRRTRAPALPAVKPQQLMSILLGRVRATHPGVDIRAIERAYTVAARLHAGQRRKNGDPYIIHPITVATIVAEIGMSAETVCAALLHDTVEDTDYSLACLREEFGDVVAHLVEGVTKLDKIKIKSGTDVPIVTQREKVLAIASDPRILVLKLADRLHNMRTIRFLTVEYCDHDQAGARRPCHECPLPRTGRPAAPHGARASAGSIGPVVALCTPSTMG